MKYTIEAIENAKPGMRWEEIGCQWTLGQAYLYSKEAGNDLPNFAEVIWDYDIEAILEDSPAATALSLRMWNRQNTGSSRKAAPTTSPM